MTSTIATALESARAAMDAATDESVERVLADAIGSLRLALELAGGKPARPTDAEYLEYRPDGAGHDAPNMPF